MEAVRKGIGICVLFLTIFTGIEYGFKAGILVFSSWCTLLALFSLYFDED